MITASIVLYNNERDILKEAISSFLNTKLEVLLFLIDNSPSDVLKDVYQDPRIIYIHNPANPGFGAAHNVAIRKSFEINSRYHLVLNPDVYYSENVLEKLTVFLDDNPQIGNIMPKVCYPDGKVQYLCKLLPTPYDWIGRRFNPFNQIVNKRNDVFELRFTGYNSIMDVPYLSGCFMYLRMSILGKIGLFDENIFMYGEETDLCRRILNGGFRTVFYPEVEVYHHFEKGSHKSWHLTKIGIRSAIYYFNKWGWFFDKERKKINRLTKKKLLNN